ncbi:MAG: hypothetical protein AB1714_31045 [Acidobacteriota bacterium]
MIWPYTMGRCEKRTHALIDQWLPEGAFMLEHHGMDMSAPPARALAATTQLALNALPFVRVLFALRGIPHRGEMTLGKMFSNKPFLLLDEDVGRELVFGIVGPFWDLRRGHMPADIPDSPGEFREAMKGGRVAAIGNFRVDPAHDGSRRSTRVWTETWAWSPQLIPTVLFTAYWLAIGPWSAWIRRMFLNEARRQAQEAQ